MKKADFLHCALIAVLMGAFFALASCTTETGGSEQGGTETVTEPTNTTADSGKTGENDTDSNASTNTESEDDETEETLTIIAPAGLTATVIDSENIFLYWNAVEGATGYQVSYGTNPSGDITESSAVTSNTQLITSLEAGTLYYFWVRAGFSDEDEIMWSDWSNSVIALTKNTSSETGQSDDSDAVLSAPVITDIAFNSDGTGFTISWQPVDGAKSYNIYYADSKNSINGYAKINTDAITGTSIDDDIWNGDFVAGSYFYKITAIAEDGTESERSAALGVRLKNPVVELYNTKTKTGSGTRTNPYIYYKNWKITFSKDGTAITRSSNNELPDAGVFDCKVTYQYKGKGMTTYTARSWTVTQEMKVGYKYRVNAMTKRIDGEPNLVREQ